MIHPEEKGEERSNDERHISVQCNNRALEIFESYWNEKICNHGGENQYKRKHKQWQYYKVIDGIKKVSQ